MLGNIRLKRYKALSCQWLSDYLPLYSVLTVNSSIFINLYLINKHCKER